jgi:pyruvate/2-oxoglutarate/acetoin dehydrogenase E1 component
VSYSEALREALRTEMRRDPAVILLGEDIGRYGGAFGVTQGLVDEFGPERVMDTPISEPGFVGMAVGAALAGSRPVVEIMFMDFIALCMDPLVNQAAKIRYVFGPQARCPIVVRTVAGGGRSYGPTHSQSLEAWFLHTPGLKIVAPATPQDAGGLLRSAIRDENPVMFIEHKRLYRQRQKIGCTDAPAPFGKARRVTEGDALTIVAYSWMVVEAEQAVAELQEEGIRADLLDLRTLNPLDMDSIVRSVRKTGRVLLVEEGCRTGGVSAEIGFRIFEQAHDYLSAPIRRVTTPDVPIPASRVLERAALPDREKIVRAARSLIRL